jgi:peptidoglycan/LPS O-acetylase OafA/YrhL
VLGRYSFAIYLVHVPILFSLGGWAFLQFYQRGIAYGYAATAAFVICLPVIGICARVLYQFVDVPSARLARLVQKMIQ